MPRTRNPYPADFREQIVALAQAGRSVEDLACEFEPRTATMKHADWNRFKTHLGRKCYPCHRKKRNPCVQYGP